jgi:hypothetical protein
VIRVGGLPGLGFKKCSMASAMVVRVIGAIVGVGACMSRTSSQALDQSRTPLPVRGSMSA